jgi:predicted NBD/HSP70 family sugar kinase
MCNSHSKPANLPGWHDYPVKDEIESRLSATVVLENDANAAALGEKWLGTGIEAGLRWRVFFLPSQTAEKRCH